MSQIKELAEREAEEAERLEAEEAARREAEHEAALDLDRIAAEGPTEEQMEAVQAENERHIAALREHMGPAFGLFEECEHCQGVGVKPRGPEPVQYEAYRQCPTCLGFGQVLTGAQQTAQAAVTCPGCAGRGFQERKSTAAPVVGVTPPAPAPEPTDEWGVPTWMGDPTIQPPPAPLIS